VQLAMTVHGSTAGERAGSSARQLRTLSMHLRQLRRHAFRAAVDGQRRHRGMPISEHFRNRGRLQRQGRRCQVSGALHSAEAAAGKPGVP
jgi:hypothetical protein